MDGKTNLNLTKNETRYVTQNMNTKDMDKNTRCGRQMQNQIFII
jgi:hypothetical protein